MYDRKTIIKIANQIRQALIKLHEQRYAETLERLTKFAEQFQELETESRKLGKSLAHNWHLATEKCCSRAHRLLCDISYSVSRINQVAEKTDRKIPKLSCLVEDLDQLQAEFGHIDFDKAASAISVATRPITLDDVYLGPFKIRLDLNKLSELFKNRPYYCIALEPNPAATSSDITHPHVSNDQLCEGDGSVTITASLQQGRICDFFSIVNNILNTYNPDSPHVALSDWDDGVPCYECGYVMGSEDSYYCEHCDREYCSECSMCCNWCEESVCLGCAADCGYCKETVCPKCLDKCPICGGDFCKRCIVKCSQCESLCCKSCLNEGLCPDCKKRKETEENGKRQENREETDKQTENKNQAETAQAAAVGPAS